jgi:hypothetical protein
MVLLVAVAPAGARRVVTDAGTKVGDGGTRGIRERVRLTYFLS